VRRVGARVAARAHVAARTRMGEPVTGVIIAVKVPQRKDGEEERVI
jgi:hypothetical protein